MPELIHRRTTVANISYHIVWSTKRRKRVIIPQMEEDFRMWAAETASAHGFAVHQLEAGHRDYVHMFVTAPPDVSVSDVIRFLKGNLSVRAFRKYSFLGRAYPQHHMWNPSMYIETIGCVSEDAVIKYIGRQDKDAATQKKGGKNAESKS